MVFKCKMCGGALEIKEAMNVCECIYCGTVQTLPRLDNEKRSNMYDRANDFRRNNEFDKAMLMYEQILAEDRMDSEAYWSLVLCTYGIKYVEDPYSHKRIPTVNRTQYISIYADENYKLAIKYANEEQRPVYEKEAAQIDEIQKVILEISDKEEPFDVFICYKEADAEGRRTRDSVLANDIYHQMTQEGYKVFFSRITLEDKIGSAYEPYIFAALHSAKVMLVLGTKPEYFNAVWVRNEWSRYLGLIKNGAKKMLIPAYRDMDPYELPKEFSNLQALDMSKLGFMQDLLHGIKKIVKDASKTEEKKEEKESDNDSGVQALLKRGEIALEYGEWENAFSYFDQVLNMDAECPEAYMGQAFSRLRVRNVEEYVKLCMGLAAEIRQTEHSFEQAFPESYKMCWDEILRMRYAGISFPKEINALLAKQPKYYTEAEDRTKQFERVFQEDVLVNKARRVQKKASPMLDRVEELYQFMKKNIEDALREDEGRRQKAEKECDAYVEKVKAYVERKLSEQAEYLEKEYEELMQKLDNGEVVNLKTLRARYKLLGDFAKCPQMVSGVTKKIEEFVEKEKQLMEERNEIVRSITEFSLDKKLSFGDKKKRRILEDKYDAVSKEIEKVREFGIYFGE